METIKIRIPLNVTRPVSESMAVEQLNAAIIKLIKVGALKGEPSEFMVGYDVKNYDAENCVVVEINKDALVDVAPFTTVGGGLSLDDEKFHWWDDKVELPKTFSVATIKERLRLKGKDMRFQVRYLINDYRRYWNSQKDKLQASETDRNNLIQIFLSDLMQLFNTILPSIKEGKQLSALLGLNSISPQLNKVAKDLSFAYKLALKSEEANGAPTKNRYIDLVGKYKAFLNALIPVVFEGIQVGNQQKEEAKEDTKTHCYKFCSDGRIDLFSNIPTKPIKGDNVRTFSKKDEQKEIDEKWNKAYEQLKKEKKINDKMTFDEIFLEVEKLVNKLK